MNAIRAYFLNRLLREKVLLVAFILLGAGMWLSNFSHRAAREWSSFRSTSNDLAVQMQWLANKNTIETKAHEAVKNLDPAKTLDETRLVGDLSAMAHEHSLNFISDSPQTVRTGQFAVHTVQVTLPRTEWNALKPFYLELMRRSPYMGLEQMSIAADHANPQLLNVSLRVVSVEIVAQ